MIHFDDFNKAASIYAEHNITRMIIPLSVDTMTECQMYRSVAAKYPDLNNKFMSQASGKSPKPGDYVRITTDSGHTVFFVFIRYIEKFQPYLLDIMQGLDKVVDVVKRELFNNAATPSGIMFPIPPGDELKLADSVTIPAIADKLNIKGIDIFALTSGDYNQRIEKITDAAVYYRRDAWKSDWMLTTDDILLIDMISLVIMMLHDYKLNKNNLVRCYYVCHQNGMFPKLEFYDTEYGKFFKMFAPKSNSLLNHGLLMNVHHYSNAEPKKFSCILGPMWPIIRDMAYTVIMENRERSLKIAADVKHEYINAFKEKKAEDPNKTQGQRSQYVKAEPQSSNMFSL